MTQFKNFFVALSALALSACAAMHGGMSSGAHGGMISVKSAFDAKTTMDRFEAAIKAKNMNVFARIDHAAGQRSIGNTLRPTEVLIWGSPAGGAPLMRCAQTVGIDLPQKALVWQDEKGDTFLSYNDPMHLMHRHGARDCDTVIANVRTALAAFAKEATQ